MGLDLVSGLFDTYDRKARLTPVLLASIPPIGVLVCLYSINLQAQTTLIGLLATLGVFSLLASICRSLGKRLEDSLYESWGGKPTTQLLRHSNCYIDFVTKTRYHSFLSKKIKTRFPTEEQESKKPEIADQVYSSAVKWLQEQTRDKKKFNLLFTENTSYGFFRNCLGIKYIAITIAFLSILWVLMAYKNLAFSGVSADNFLIFPIGIIASLSISVSMIGVWMFYFTKNSVKSAAFTYAVSLLRTCDILAQQNALITVDAKASQS